MIQKCGHCGEHVYYPRVLCPHCGSDQLDWIEPSGQGTVYSVTLVRRRPDKGGDFNVCLVDLEEGPRVMSRVEGVPLEDIQIGMAVEAFVGDAAGAPNVLFRPAAGP